MTETATVNIQPMDEKSTEMSQIPIVSGENNSVLPSQQTALTETSPNQGFHVTNNHAFRCLNRYYKRKKRYLMAPEYRKRKFYVKSVKQYKKERLRRKTVLRFSRSGLTYVQIAERLGVSVKTVQRDMKRTSRYVLGQARKAWFKIEQERKTKLDAEMEGLSLGQKFAHLTQLLRQQLWMDKVRTYNRHRAKIIFNLQSFQNGQHPFRLEPSHATLTNPFHFDVIVEVNGQQFRTGSISIGEKPHRPQPEWLKQRVR